jgi:hypothetical protein
MSKDFHWPLLFPQPPRISRYIQTVLGQKACSSGYEPQWTWQESGAVLNPGAQIVDDSQAVVVHRLIIHS